MRPWSYFGVLLTVLLFATGCPSWHRRGGFVDQAMHQDQLNLRKDIYPRNCGPGYRWGPPVQCQGEACNDMGCQPAYNTP